MTHETLESYKKMDAELSQLAGSATQLAIFFADLVDSTAVKESNELEGIRKVYRHNKVISETVRSLGGTVVKYVGDETIATFTDPKAALQAAVNTQNALIELNQHYGLNNTPHKIESKMSVHFGSIYPFPTFPSGGDKIIDPMGLTVDMTARLVGHANKGQILCTEPVKAGLVVRQALREE